MKPVLVSSGEPAGIGPDICLDLAELDYPLVILGDKSLLEQRAAQLKRRIAFVDYDPTKTVVPQKGTLAVLSVATPLPVTAGLLEVGNASYVMKLLEVAVRCMQEKAFSALVTAPIHKEIINQAGIPFTGHTEFLATQSKAKQVVMMLASEALRVALITTHLPLRAVPDFINQTLIISVIQQLHASLQESFGLARPRILVAGLNPHAGEGGYLGREELDTIIPALEILRKQGIAVEGPFPADTMFNLRADAFVAMYHDQGLPVLKFASFGQAVNISLGLPFIRTSVDHGTALALAGSGKAQSSSLMSAIEMALTMAGHKEKHAEN